MATSSDVLHAINVGSNVGDDFACNTYSGRKRPPVNRNGWRPSCSHSTLRAIRYRALLHRWAFCPSYEADLGQELGRVRLKYTTTRWGEERHESDYWIRLETTPQPFGGRRWWFICPRTGRRAAKLYLPNGAFTFASRQAYRLAYRSQREAPPDRALRRAFKLRGKLGADGGIGDYVPKPKWMRWPTYDRKLEEIFAAEEVVDTHLAAFVGKLERRSRR